MGAGTVKIDLYLLTDYLSSINGTTRWRTEFLKIRHTHKYVGFGSVFFQVALAVVTRSYVIQLGIVDLHIPVHRQYSLHTTHA